MAWTFLSMTMRQGRLLAVCCFRTPLGFMDNALTALLLRLQTARIAIRLTTADMAMQHFRPIGKCRGVVMATMHTLLHNMLRATADHQLRLDTAWVVRR